jgi:3-deoxy-D-manno-octulosonate 8-phosphate phosphatase KdsC-like HAD superfamily phosphatase
MIGDDIGDLAGFAECGLRVAVGDAVAEVIDAADLVCERPGGHGAVRELADAMLTSVGGRPSTMASLHGRTVGSPWS